MDDFLNQFKKQTTTNNEQKPCETEREQLTERFESLCDFGRNSIQKENNLYFWNQKQLDYFKSKYKWLVLLWREI